MNSYRHRAQRRFPLWSWYNFFALHFGQAIFAIFNSVNHSLIWVLKKQFTLIFKSHQVRQTPPAAALAPLPVPAPVAGGVERVAWDLPVMD
jgi:hypothetical protein